MSELRRTTPMKRTAFKPSEPKPSPSIRKRKCKACKTPFTPFRSFEAWCSPECGEIIAKDRLAAQTRKIDRQHKQALKTKRDYVKEAQISFNSWVRYRDSKEICISCGAAFNDGVPGGGMDCGHYRSVGSAPHLRFDTDNAHGQCKKCNRWGAGRAVDYRIGLIARIGLSRVERLESDNSVKKWTIEELQAIRDHYRLKLKQLKESQS
jgi:predicted nucleic acid-binding Zn ribbon protein